MTLATDLIDQLNGCVCTFHSLITCSSLTNRCSFNDKSMFLKRLHYKILDHYST